MEGFNYEGYKLIVKCREKDLVEYLGRQIPKIYGEENCVVTNDYVFAKGTCPVVLCSHMDTIFAESKPPETILYDPTNELLWSPDGIGGDDRNGVYSILHIINKMKDNLPSVLFTTKEESGCLGANKAVKHLKDKIDGIKFAIQIDRQGVDDAVFYGCKNRAFIDYICGFGYKEQHGSRTDISVFCPEWNIAGVNFSCGYMQNHTKNEIVNVKDMFSTINMVLKILEDAKNAEFFAYAAPVLYKKNENIGKTALESAGNNQNSFYDEEDAPFPKVISDDDEKLLAAIYGEDAVKDPFFSKGT